MAEDLPPEVAAAATRNQRPTSLPANRSRPLSTVSLHSPPLSPLSDNTIDKAFDGFFSGSRAKSQKHKSMPQMTIDEIPPHDIESTEKQKELPQTPKSPGFSPYVEEWPSEPAPLGHDDVYLFLLDVCLTALPLLPIAYAMACVALDHRPTVWNYRIKGQWSWSAYVYGPLMMKAQKVAPTIVPMIMGISFARLIRSFALWRSERGIRIGFLEQLNASQSLAGTLSALWGLRIFLNVAGIMLLALWGLSVAGSQVSLRIIGVNGTTTDTGIVTYMNTNATPDGLLLDTNAPSYYQFAVNGMYATTILTPGTMESPQDPWTNVKIPNIEWLEQNNGCDSDGWCSFENAEKNSAESNISVVDSGAYTSLIGMPVVSGQYGLGVQTFSLQTSYFNLTCPSLNLVDPTVEIHSALPNRSVYNTQPDSAIWNSDDGSTQTFFVDTNTPVADAGSTVGDARVRGGHISPRNIVFGSRTPQNKTALANCSIALTHVESAVTCNFTSPLWNIDLSSTGRSAAGACLVSRVRRSLVDTRPRGYTDFDKSYHVPRRFFSAWPGATGSVPPGSSSPSERFLVNIESNSVTNKNNRSLVAANWLGFGVHDATGGQNHYVDLTTLTLQTFTSRLQLLFNTYYHSWCNVQAMTQSEIGLGYGASFPLSVMFDSTSVTTILSGQSYTINWVMLSIFLVCSFISLFAGILAMVLKHKTLAPDVLGSVGSLIRWNPYTPVPMGGSTLDGPDYVRMVLHTPVRFSDVDPSGAVGRVALTTVGDGGDGEEGGMFKKLEKGRLYL